MEEPLCNSPAVRAGRRWFHCSDGASACRIRPPIADIPTREIGRRCTSLPLLWWTDLMQVNVLAAYSLALFTRNGEGHESGCIGSAKIVQVFCHTNHRRVLAIGVSGAAAAAPYKSNQIRVEYALPKNPTHQSIYDRLKQARALERIQTLLSPLQLPRPLLLKVSGRDGEFERLV